MIMSSLKKQSNSDNFLKTPVFTKQVKILKNTQFWTKEKLRDLQREKLQHLVRHVSKRIPFYHRFLQKNCLTWKDFSNAEDVKKFPFITKKFLQDNYDMFLPLGVDKRSLIDRTTGGSTGTPLTVYGDAAFFARDRANTQHYMQVFDLDIFNYKSIRLYGDKIAEEVLEKGIYWYLVENRKIIMSCYHITNDTARRYVDKINEFGPVYIHTRPSSVLPLANYILQEGLRIKKPVKYIFCDGEYITDGQRKRIEAAFNGRCISIYGHTEGCVVGHSCKVSDNLHFMPQVGIVELLDAEGNEVSEEGQKGELVVTGFNNMIFPLIRYKTGDIAILGNQDCSCGRNYKILASVEGRMQDYVVDRNGNLVPLAPAIFNYNDMDWKGVREFKVFQEKEGELKFKILPESELRGRFDLTRDTFKSKIEEILGLTFDVEIELVSELHKTSIGKYRYLEQRLDMSKYFKRNQVLDL